VRVGPLTVRRPPLTLYAQAALLSVVRNAEVGYAFEMDEPGAAPPQPRKDAYIVPAQVNKSILAATAGTPARQSVTDKS